MMAPMFSAADTIRSKRDGRVLDAPAIQAFIAAVADGGVLVYETFLQGHERLGRPRNPHFLLQPGELRQAVAGHLEVVAFEEGPDGDPPTAYRQRICARR